MKRSILFHLLLATALVLGGSVGCKKRAKNPTPITGQVRQVPANTGDFGPPEVAIGVPGPRDTSGRDVPNPQKNPNTDVVKPEPIVDLGDMKPDAAYFKANTVYFEFDRAAIKESERGKIDGVATHLANNPSHAVRIAGHCDERGTEGYNLSLGERRALAVREYLAQLGVAQNRIDTISYGESMPAVQGSGEKVWSKNRRGEFILLTPP